MKPLNPFLPRLSSEHFASPVTAEWRSFGTVGEEIWPLVKTLNQMAAAAALNPLVREAAENIIPHERDPAPLDMIRALVNYVRQHVVYVPDPVDTETYKTPVLMLRQIAERGVTGGDCDDHVLLYASLAMSVGIPTRIRAVQIQPGGRFNHVIAESWDGRRWIPIDLIDKLNINHEYNVML